MLESDAQFFRKYADIITEADAQQLDEGIVDSIKSAIAKLTAMSSVNRNLPSAKAKLPQLFAALRSSKSSKELMSNLQKSIGANTTVQQEGISTSSVMAAGGSVIVAAAGKMLLDLYNNMGRPDLETLMNAQTVSGNSGAGWVLAALLAIGAFCIAASPVAKGYSL